VPKLDQPAVALSVALGEVGLLDGMNLGEDRLDVPIVRLGRWVLGEGSPPLAPFA